eukprot:TRINITY_DN7963_c0_g1_i2.p1 TRINITY_DN7963_c0_g1~~TRINITY_DN7963_c0_g1_i2.p1  ORF type:complete len:402 (-),score=65.80 TRINITY_DN7963_c0_g1_i2:222-1427(-)
MLPCLSRVRPCRQTLQRFTCRLFAASAGPAAAKRTTSEMQLFAQQLKLLEQMEQDLKFLESGIGHFRKTKDLHPLKAKWRLSAKINGSNISPADAREAVCQELRNEVERLRSSTKSFSVQAPASVLQAGSMSIAAPQVAVLPAGTPAGGQNRLMLGGGVAVGLAGLVVWQMQPASAPPSESREAAVASPPQVPSSGTAADATITDGRRATTPAVEKDAKAATRQRGAVAGSKEAAAPAASSSTIPEAAVPDVTGADAARRADQVAVTDGENLWTSPTTWAVLALTVAGAAGICWLLFVRQQPPPPPAGGLDYSASSGMPAAPTAVAAAEIRKVQQTDSLPSTGASLDLGTATDSVRRRQAGEVWFENAPKDGQAWDMTGSVRGVSGGVSQKVSQFQGGGRS